MINVFGKINKQSCLCPAMDILKFPMSINVVAYISLPLSLFNYIRCIVSFWSTADWSNQNCLFTTREVFKSTLGLMLICCLCIYIPTLNKFTYSELHKNSWNWDNVSYIRMTVIDKALILMLNHNLGSTIFCKINDENQKLYCDSIKTAKLPFPNAYLSIQNF
jgi:hypothetical protein